MRTVGQILRESRESKLYSLEDVEKTTKIRKNLLVALESDDYQKLPSYTFVRGFIRNYARFLNLDSEKMLAIFRREFAENKHQPYIMDTFAKPLKTGRFQITPTRVFGLAIFLLVAVFFIYLWIQYRQFTGTPQLMINTPQDQMTIETEKIEVAGKTDPEVKILINGQEIAVGEEGTFKTEITLPDPVNKIIIQAISKLGQKIQTERTVYLKR